MIESLLLLILIVNTITFITILYLITTITKDSSLIRSYLHNIYNIRQELKKNSALNEKLILCVSESDNKETLDSLLKAIYNIRYYLGVAYRDELIAFANRKKDYAEQEIIDSD